MKVEEIWDLQVRAVRVAVCILGGDIGGGCNLDVHEVLGFTGKAVPIEGVVSKVSFCFNFLLSSPLLSFCSYQEFG